MKPFGKIKVRSIKMRTTRSLVGVCLVLFAGDMVSEAATLAGDVTYADGTPAWFGVSIKDEEGNTVLPDHHIPVFKKGKFGYGIDGDTWFNFGSYKLPLLPGKYSVTVTPMEGWRQETTTLDIVDWEQARFDVKLKRAKSVEAPTRIRITVLEDGKPQAARIGVTAIDPETNEVVALTPGGVLPRTYRIRHNWFHAWGGCEVIVPSNITGPIEIHAVRGTEYEFIDKEITPKRGEVTDVALDMKRWVNLADEGWYSGDVHTHILGAAGPRGFRRAPKAFAAHAIELMKAEDLRVGAWLMCPGDPNKDRGFYNDGTYHIKFDQEPRNSTYGHIHALLTKYHVEQYNTGKMFSKGRGDYPSNLPMIKAFKEAGAYVGYAHPVAGGLPGVVTEFLPKLEKTKGINHTAICRGLPSDAVLGKVDLLEVYSCSSSEEGAEKLWRHLMNCGFGVMPAAGTDSFNGSHQYTSPPGGLRVFVKVDGNLTYRKWVEILATGRSFLTSGPALMLQVDGKDPGHTFEVKKGGGKFKASVHLRSNLPVAVVEVLVGDKVVKTFDVKEQWKDFKGECTVEATESTYITARANGNRKFEEMLDDEVRALTGPVLVTVDGQPRRSVKSARFFAKWINDFEEILETEGKFDNDEDKQEVLAELHEARKYYEAMAGGKVSGKLTVYSK
ncbi:CehA/McbA family metallohydrolase [Candidatus Hydrogenedentota bacterium]